MKSVQKFRAETEAAAAEVLNALGIEITDVDDGVPFLLAGDFLYTPQAFVLRVDASPMTVVSPGSGLPPGQRCTVVMSGTGAISFRSERGDLSAECGEMLIYDASIPHTASFALGATLFAAEFDVRRLLGNSSLLPQRVELTDYHQKIIWGLFNATMNERNVVTGDGYAPVMSALASVLVAGMLASGDSGDPIAAQQTSTSVLHRARTLIVSSFSDVELSANTLADRLNVSVSQLHRAFAAVGGSPAQEIRALRADLARHLLALPNAASSAEIARVSGSGSSRRMQRALGTEE